MGIADGGVMYFTGIPVVSSDLAVKIETWVKKWKRNGRPNAQPKTRIRNRYIPQAYLIGGPADGKQFVMHPSIVRKLEAEFTRQDSIVDGAIKWVERSQEMKDLFLDLRKMRYEEPRKFEFKVPAMGARKPLPFFTHFGGSA